MKKLLLITHINPFSGHSGQSQRVKYMLQALQHDFDVHVLFGTYDEKQKTGFIDGIGRSNFKVKASAFTHRRRCWDKIGAVYCEYVVGLKSSNYFIAKLLDYDSLQTQVKVADYDVVFFEYWHAYKTARKINRSHPGIATICDTHNILSATYGLYVNAHAVKKMFSAWYQKKYNHIEFKEALPSFSHLIAINLAEYETLLKSFGKEKVWYCPMGVDLSLFADAPAYAPRLPFVVLYYGGLGSLHNQNAAIEVYKNFVQPAVSQGLAVQYKIVGSNPPSNFVQHFDEKIVTIIGFSSRLTDAFAGVSLAIIPWQGKYGFRSRLIELSACGVPIFTASDAVWGMGYEHGKTAFVFDDMDGHAYDSFVSLYDKSDTLARVSQQAKQFVNAQYAYQNTYVAFSQKLKQMAAASSK